MRSAKRAAASALMPCGCRKLCRGWSGGMSVFVDEAAVLFLAKCPEAKNLFARIEKKHGKGKALSILAHKLGRAVYFMLARKQPFDLERFLRS